MPVNPATWELRQENCLNLGGGGCCEPRWCHCTPAWAARGKLTSNLKKSGGRDLKQPYNPTVSLLSIYPNEYKSFYHKDTGMWMFITALFTIVKTWKLT